MTAGFDGGDLPPRPGGGEPSDWVQRWGAQVRAKGRVLDVACGHGRHARWFAALCCRVVAVDRDADALAVVRLGLAPDAAARVDVLHADLETGAWPFDAGTPAGRFDGVVVTNYLWRPLLPAIVASVAPGGWLIYETFAVEQAGIGRPRRAEFLLRPGELLDAVGALRIVAYEHGLLAAPRRHVQRIAAVAPPVDPASGLDGPMLFS